MTRDEFALWKDITGNSRFHWTEDAIFRLNGRGAFYYIGGEDGGYMRIHKDGRLELGSYEGAVPHIGEAVFMPKSEKQYADFNEAFTTAIQLGGKRFLVDMFGGTPAVLLTFPHNEKPSVLEQIKEARDIHRPKKETGEKSKKKRIELNYEPQASRPQAFGAVPLCRHRGGGRPHPGAHGGDGHHQFGSLLSQGGH